MRKNTDTIMPNPLHSYEDILKLIGTPKLRPDHMVWIRCENGSGTEYITLREAQKRRFDYGLGWLGYCKWLLYENILFFDKRYNECKDYIVERAKDRVQDKITFERYWELMPSAHSQLNYCDKVIHLIGPFLKAVHECRDGSMDDLIYGQYYGLIKFPYHPFQDRGKAVELIKSFGSGNYKSYSKC